MLALLFLLFLLFPPFVQPASKPLTLTLTRTASTTPDSPADPWTKLSLLASSSLARAHRLKRRRNHHHHQAAEFGPDANVDLTVSVSPHSSGEYALTLSFGTPPQPLNFSLDTSSSLAWFPCTERFRCPNCPSSSSGIPYFVPKSSSSARFFGCTDPKCRWIHRRVPSNCSSAPASCPPFFLISGGGINGGGLLLSETLSLAGKQVPGFAVGCSVFSDHQPIGVAAFGRGPPSLPYQLGAGSFSYCLPSHRLDDAPGAKGALVLGADPLAGNGLTFTPFVKNPAGSGAYYYLDLDAITVGGVAVRVTPLGPGGDGGAIVDSGASFTVVEAGVHEQLVAEFTRQVRNYRRATSTEARSSLRPCFDVTGQKTVTLPEMALRFEGGAIMRLPLKNYFSFVGETDAVCLTVVGGGGGGGPAVVLGNFQQQDFYMVFDADRERLGFRQQTCNA
ncbi:Aspartic proteinase nepenthesin-2 [Nymphaea thermarum]|nr:Aspartic proteinase nepenthesin-2 [Nymphaea thermarum]